jgi:uroporphyrin-III C-methyltransferase/precorrin-2 dehydrogenase/sirohydrochlorin ferrochelatase
VAFGFPVSLELRGRRCVVLGGGEMAEPKVRALLDAGADVTVIAPDPSEGVAALGRQGRITLVQRVYERGDLSGAFLAIAASDPEVTAAAFAEAEDERVLFNAVDDVAHCHFAAPSVVRRGDLTVAISTGGRAPALAKRLREQLSDVLGPEYAAVIELLSEAREEALRTRDVEFPVWAERWARAVAHDLPGLVAEGRVGEARSLVDRSLSGAEEASADRAHVAIVGAGPGDPGLITVRGKRLVDEADVVVHDTLVHPDLYAGKVAIPAEKESGQRGVSQERTSALLIRLARKGKRVVRLKGGDPYVFGRGAEEAKAIADAGIPFEVVPAPSSVIAVPAYAGIPVTDRRLASSVAFVAGHTTGRPVDWHLLARSVDTLVILMGRDRLTSIVAALIQGGRDASTPAAVIENGTLPGQRVVTARLEDLPAVAAQRGFGSPSLVVIGDVVGLRDGLVHVRREPGTASGI